MYVQKQSKQTGQKQSTIHIFIRTFHNIYLHIIQDVHTSKKTLQTK